MKKEHEVIKKTHSKDKMCLWNKKNSVEEKEGFPIGSVVKNLPAVQEIWVWSVGGEDSLEEGMATHSSILAWRVPWQRSLGGYSPWGHRELDSTERLSATHTEQKEINPQIQ